MKFFVDHYKDVDTFEFKVLHENVMEQNRIIAIDSIDEILEHFGRYTGTKIEGENEPR